MSDFHGRFIWYELMTPDVAGAKAFYGRLVGWTSTDMPMPGMVYSVFEADGSGVGGAIVLSDEHKAAGVPPNWTGYVAVTDVDAASESVTRLGGSVMRPPEDIPDVGRFAIVADPTGAVFAMMTPAPQDPPRPEAPMGALGHTSWHELYSSEPDKAFAFYAEMFGWTKSDALDMGEMGTYQLFENRFGQGGGMMGRPSQMPVSAWVYYFQVGDISEAKARLEGAGGKVLMGPMEVPGGDWIIQGVDPQGAMFAIVGKKT